jgi:lycopene cyclase domain-containing protein
MNPAIQPLGLGAYTYLFLILVWALPIIVMQWLLGLDLFLKRWKVWLPGILIPTLWLTFADAFALGSKTWTIDPKQSLNIFLPFGVPLEEGIFFLCTNTLVVQGMILFCMPGVLARMKRIVRVLRYGPKSLPTPGEPPAAPDRAGL